MKIQALLAAVVLPAVLLLNVSNANAQRRNTTSHDVKPVMLNQPEAEAPAVYQDNIVRPDAEQVKIRKHQKDKYKKAMKNKCGCKDCKKGGFCNCGKDGGCMKNKMMKKHHREARENIEEINEDFHKANKRIEKSSFNENQRELLRKQARHNKDLALKQLKEREDLRQKHIQERMDAGVHKMMKDNKVNRKAVKKIDDID